MVQILPEAPSFRTQLARNLGGGFTQGVNTGAEFASKLALEKSKKRMRQEMINKILMGQAPDQMMEGQKTFSDQLSGTKTGGISEPVEDIKKAELFALADEPTLSKFYAKRGEIEEQKKELPRQEYIKQDYKSLPKFMEGIEAAEDKMPIADISIKLAEEAIESPGKWAAYRDYLAENTGYEGFRSAKGAELQSAIKQYFLGDLASIKGGRPNQLIEKQLLDAYPRIGRDPISNQKILVGMKMQQEIQKIKVDETRKLEEKYLAEQGYLPPGFQGIVKKTIRSKIEEVEKKTINQLTSLSKFQGEYEKLAKKQLQTGEILMMSPNGEYEAIPKKSIQEAKDQGYIKLAG